MRALPMWDCADDEAADWPEPEPLAKTLAPLRYPIDALPRLIRGAVEEVQSFVHAPVPLVAASALSANAAKHYAEDAPFRVGSSARFISKPSHGGGISHSNLLDARFFGRPSR